MSGANNKKIKAAARVVLLACGSVGAAVLVRLAFGDALGDSVPFLTFFPAVLIAALFGGWPAGVIAALLTILAGKVYFLEIGARQPPMIVGVIYLIGCGVSIVAADKLRKASDRYRKAEHKLATALEVSGVGTWRWDVAQDALDCDERLCRIIGVDPGRSPARLADFLQLIVEEDRERMRQLIAQSLREPRAAEFVYRIQHPERGVRWIADRNNVLCGADGKPIEIVGASMDVTERKQADEHRDLLIRELHHRVRNTLAMVQGMANATANSAQDLAHFKETFARRIASLAMTHALLTDERTQSTTLSRLVRQELEALGMADRLDLSGADLMLPSDLAVPIGMAMHELATNALKHGALREGVGRVSVAFVMNEDAGEIIWSEVGGPVVAPSQRRGFGAQLLDRVISVQLGASTTRSFEPEGMRVTISIPREKLTVHANDEPSPLRAKAS